MNNIWKELDETMNTEELARQVAELENRNKKQYVTVPYGLYEVKVTSLDLTLSRQNKLMLVCDMTIVNGEYKNRRLRMYQSVSFAKGIVKANKFLKDLTKSLSPGIDIYYATNQQYGNLILDIMEAIDGKFEYQINYSENKGFKNFKIEEVFVL